MADVSSSPSQPRAGRPGRVAGIRWFIPIITIVVVVAVIAVPAALPAPAFDLGPVTMDRTCHLDPAGGNYSFWLVSFDITNHGASASAAVAILINGTPVSTEHVAVASGASVTVHANVTDAAIPVDVACAPHDVTAAIWGFLF